MKKSLKIIFGIILLIAMVLPITYSNALASTNINLNPKEKHFFEISKLEVTKKDKIEMKLNLDYIKSDEFVFELKSDDGLKDVEISQNDEIETEKNNNEIIMEVNKEKTNIKNINLYYWVPNNKQVGDTIKFIATVTGIIENDNDEKELIDNEEMETEIQSIEFEVKIIEDENNESETQIPSKDDIKENDKQEILNTDNIKDNDTQETQIPNTDDIKENDKQEIPNIDNIKDNDKQETQIPNTDDIKENEKPKIPNTDNEKTEIKISNEDDIKENNKQPIDNNNEQMPNKNNMPSTINKVTTSNISYTQYSGINSQPFSSNQAEKPVTYNGSDNNYLKELVVNDYTLNKEFSKENTTYFMTVQNEIEKLDITALAENSGATICIYGNENLKLGTTNKVLISVTAENGNVRTYRIYVTKKA